MKIGIITLFPEIFPGPIGCSVLKRGLIEKSWELCIINLKEYAAHLDDTPYGGGEGMIIRADILGKCIDDHISQYEELVFPVPFGIPWTQKQIEMIGKRKSLLFVCGRYEGIDYRIYQHYEAHYNVSYFSIGDYIMCGGELPAMVIIESLVRTHLLRPSVIQEESFSTVGEDNQRLLESPQYTRPENWRNLPVPPILLSGHHKNIAQWKLEQSLLCTKKYRPDLLNDF